MNRLLFWLSGILILGVMAVLLFRPGEVSDITIVILMLAAAIGAFVVYRGDEKRR